MSKTLQGHRTKLNKKPFNGQIKTAEQRNIIQQYGHWYTGR